MRKSLHKTSHDHPTRQTNVLKPSKSHVKPMKHVHLMLKHVSQKSLVLPM